MKTADIEVGVDYGMGRPSDISYRMLKRVTVLAVGVERVYHVGRVGLRRTAQDGILVKRASDDVEEVTFAARVQMTWAEYEAMNASTDVARAKAKEVREQRTKDLTARLALVLPEGFERPWWLDVSNPDTIAKYLPVLEAVHEEGRLKGVEEIVQGEGS